MEDLLGAYSSISAWLANQAMDARFELARFAQERDKYTELSAVDRFLQSAAVARVKYPQRMQNLEAEFHKLRHRSLMRLESELFALLPQPRLKNAPLQDHADREIREACRQLYESSEALFKISEQFSEKIRTFIDTQGV